MYKFGFNLTMCLIQLCVNSKRTLELSTKKNIKLTESSTQADFLFKRNQVLKNAIILFVVCVTAIVPQ